MYIISSFHDYYDTAMSYGIDKSCVYARDVSEIHFNLKIDLPREVQITFSNGIGLRIIPMIIGFCGKMYPTIKFEYSPGYGILQAPKDEYFFRFQDFEDKINMTIGFDKKTRYFWSRGYINSESTAKLFFENEFTSLLSMFREYHAPVILIEESSKTRTDIKLTVNPNLRQLQFVKHKDPYTAFQEISMYLAGVLGNKEKSTVQISDKDMLKQKGFDEYSFKTMKGDKKPRAKNRGKG